MLRPAKRVNDRVAEEGRIIKSLIVSDANLIIRTSGILNCSGRYSGGTDVRTTEVPYQL